MTDLDKEIEQYFDGWSEDEYNGAACHYQYVRLQDCKAIARHFADWQRKQFAKDSCCWLDKNLTNSPDGELIVKYGGVVAKGTFIREFRKAMKFKDDAEGE